MTHNTTHDTTHECPVCLDAIEPKDACHTRCGHVFHSACAFRAIRLDPRCSICRAQLVPEEAPTTRDVHIEINGVEFGEFADNMKRLRRNYHARRRRVEGRHPQLRDLRAQWQVAEQALGESDQRYEQLYEQEARLVERGLAMRAQKRERERAMRRERDTRTKYEEMLKVVMGEEPPSPLEQLLVERLGGDLHG